MRIISGEFKGHQLKPPLKNWPTRPTTDFAREALFNILENLIDLRKIRMLELFGGTGAHSIEAASRGCHDISYVEKHGPCFRYVSKIIKEWGIADRIKCFKMDCKRFIRQSELNYDYIFADPPYQQLEWIHLPEMIMQQGLLAKGGLLVIEHSPLLDFSDKPGFDELRKYGQSRFSFFRP